MLWFFDIESGGNIAQATVNVQELREFKDSAVSRDTLLSTLKSIRAGDWISEARREADCSTQLTNGLHSCDRLVAYSER